MQDKISGKTVASGVAWAFGERIVAQSISFVVSILLARMLLPEDYGAVSLVLVFINLANVFVSNGLGESLVQKADATALDFSTIFYCGLAMAAALYAIIFFSAPSIADFYTNPDLISVIRVVALALPVTAVNTVQNAYVSRNMIFRKFFMSTLFGSALSGAVGVIMALNGFGVWALVAQYLTNTLVGTFVLFLIIPWRPQWQFSLMEAKILLRFGTKIMGAEFINTAYTQLRTLIIGKIYNTSQLAYYQKGDSFPSLVITNIDTAVSKVLFPSMVRVNTNSRDLKRFVRKSMRITSYVIFPIMIGLAVIAKPLILVLLTEKWLPCVKYLQILSIYWMFQPVLTANWQVIKAMGRSDLCLLLELVKKTVGILLVLGSMFISVEALAVSNIVLAIFSVFVNMVPCTKLIGYAVKEQIKDLLPAFLLSILMGLAVFALNAASLPTLGLLIAQIVVGAIVYIALSLVFRVQSFFDCLKLLRSYLVRA